MHMAKKEEQRLYYETGVNPNYETGQRPTAEEPPAVAYDNTTDYMAKMQEAANRGDYTAAYLYEQQRNAKIKGEGLNMPTTQTYAHYNPETRYKYDPNQNADYQRYDAMMTDLFQKIMSGGKFEYDMENDPLYQQYRTQYMREGRNAMRDTMGQAAALTGGYGNTYAQSAGEQAYGRYLERLNDVMPELYGQAYSRWQNEQNGLRDQYQMAASLANNAYDRGYNQWSTQLGLERADEQTAYERRMNEENTAYERAHTATNEARSYALAVLQTGVMPNAQILAEAGIPYDEAERIRQAVLLQQSFNGGSGGGRSSGGGGGGRRRSSGSGSGSSEAAAQTPQQSNGFSDSTKTVADIKSAITNGASEYRVEQMIKSALDGGLINEAVALALRGMLKKRGGN